MSEELFVRCCAPTLAGIKTGSMFSCDYADPDALRDDMRRMNRLLRPKGLRILPLRYRNGTALLYVYRPDQLRHDVDCPAAREILRRSGYENKGCEECVCVLKRKLQSGEAFPHEVGLFLSYPPEDVRGFIENHARNYKLIGYWKVYGDETSARSTFDRYKKVTDCYCRSLKAGMSLPELVVAV